MDMEKALFVFFTIMCAGACSKDVDVIVPGAADGIGLIPPPIGTAVPRTELCGATDESSIFPASVQSSINGTWKGTMDDYVFPFGSSTVVLDLTYQTSGSVLGTLRLGDSLLAPPSNGDVGYPTDVRFFVSSNQAQPPEPPYDGFSYTVLDGVFDGPTLTFGMQPREAWKSWCELQEMVYLLSSNFACAPPARLTQEVPVALDGTSQCIGVLGDAGPSTDCDKEALCVVQANATVVSGVCDCTSLGCSVCLLPGSAPMTFTLKLQGDTLAGAITATDTPSMPTLAASIGGKTLTLHRQTQ